MMRNLWVSCVSYTYVQVDFSLRARLRAFCGFCLILRRFLPGRSYKPRARGLVHALHSLYPGHFCSSAFYIS